MLKQFDRGSLFTPPSERGAVQLPGNVGGADWGGAGVDPATGMLGDTGAGNMRYRRGGVGNPPTLDGLALYKPPYSRVSAIDLNTGTIAWQVPIGDGPRDHPLLKDLKLGPLGNGARGSPVLTSTLVFVSQYSGGLGRGTVIKVGGREPTTMPTEAQKFRAYDKKTGELVWEKEMPGPVRAEVN